MSHYETLGISKNASKDDIKNAYRKLAKIYHPDKNTNNNSKESFQRIQEAYETLIDSDKKNAYDNPFHQQPFQMPFHNFFNFNSSNNFPLKKKDEFYVLKISLSDVYFGITKNFNIKKKYSCDSCKITCNTCNGLGNLPGQRIQLGPMIHVIHQQCNNCSGHGIINNKCSDCNFVGFKIKEKFIELILPKGIENGKQFTYIGFGEQKVKNNEISGDFIIQVEVEPHPIFTRDNLDLIYTCQISIFESIIGKDIKINFFDESIDVNLNKFGIINPHKEYVIIEKGLINEKNQRGNIKIKCQIIYPDKTLETDEIAQINDIFHKTNLI